jgi:hypothetical protein
MSLIMHVRLCSYSPILLVCLSWMANRHRQSLQLFNAFSAHYHVNLASLNHVLTRANGSRTLQRPAPSQDLSPRFPYSPRLRSLHPRRVDSPVLTVVSHWPWLDRFMPAVPPRTQRMEGLFSAFLSLTRYLHQQHTLTSVLSHCMGLYYFDFTASSSRVYPSSATLCTLQHRLLRGSIPRCLLLRTRFFARHAWTCLARIDTIVRLSNIDITTPLRLSVGLYSCHAHFVLASSSFTRDTLMTKL